MTDADPSSGEAFGFARMPASERQPPRLAMKQAPKEWGPTNDPVTSGVALEKEAGLKPPKGPSEAKRRRRSSSSSEVKPEVKSKVKPEVETKAKPKAKPKIVLGGEETDATSIGTQREPMVWLAISLAGLTYMIGVTGFLSLLRTF